MQSQSTPSRARPHPSYAFRTPPGGLRLTAIAVTTIYDILHTMHSFNVPRNLVSHPALRVICIFCSLLFLWTLNGGNAFAEEVKTPQYHTATAPQIDSFTITQRGDGYRVSISYPQTGNPVADAELAIWAREQAAAFADAVRLIPTPPPVPYELSVSYHTLLSPERTISVIFFISTAMGGPHPEPGMATFVYDKRDGRRLSYADIFMRQEDLAQTFSDICHKALREQLSDRADEAMLKAGTTPDITNFDLFALVKDGVRIYFPPYQAAPYSEGYLDVTIPLSDLTQFKPQTEFWNLP